MSGWGKVEERRQRRGFNRVFLPLMLFACLLLVVVAKVSPEQDTYTSNADAPMVTRTLVPRETTTTRATPTTVARSSSATSAEATLDMVILIDGSRVYYLQRTPAVMLALYMATAGAR